jgi:hypothetical protein
MHKGAMNADKIPEIFNKKISVNPYAVSFGLPCI